MGRLSFVEFSHLWTVLLVLAFWLYAACLARLAVGRFTLTGALVAGLLLGSMPNVYLTLGLGQAEPFIWALFGLACCLPNGELLLALSAQIKPYALWALLSAARRRGIRVLLPAFAVLLGGILFGGVCCGFSAYVAWVRYALPVVAQGTYNPDNISFAFAGLRVARAVGWQSGAGPLPPLARGYLAFVGLAAPLIAIEVTRKTKARVQYGLVVGTAILFSPLCWTCYLPLLLTPLACSLNTVRDRQKRPDLLKT